MYLNDNYEHVAGYCVLKTIGSLLLNTMRGAENALRVAHNLCASVSELHLAIKELSLGKLSVSIGISIYPKNGMLSDELTKLADIALYEAKGRGRDQA